MSSNQEIKAAGTAKKDASLMDEMAQLMEENEAPAAESTRSTNITATVTVLPVDKQQGTASGQQISTKNEVELPMETSSVEDHQQQMDVKPQLVFSNSQISESQQGLITLTLLDGEKLPPGLVISDGTHLIEASGTSTTTTPIAGTSNGIVGDMNSQDEADTLESAWSETGCIICNEDIEDLDQDKGSSNTQALKQYYCKYLAVGEDVNLADEKIYNFCKTCTQDVEKLMAIGHKIEFMYKQFHKVREAVARRSVKTFIQRYKPDLLDEDALAEHNPLLFPNRVSHKDELFNRWKSHFELVQPGPKSPVMIRSMDSRGRVTVLRVDSKGKPIPVPDRYRTNKRPSQSGMSGGKQNADFAEDDEYDEAILAESNSSLAVYKCRECPKSFTSRLMLRYHLKAHTGDHPYECHFCGRGFAVSHYLTSHIRSHTGEKPFTCEKCGKGFSQRGGLATHSLVHSGQKPFRCSLCNKSFRQKYHLTQHLMVHSGAKPFRCDICSKSFNVKMNLREHMRRHTGDRPYKCPYCVVPGYFRKKMLREHISKAHPDKPIPEELCAENGIENDEDSRDADASMQEENGVVMNSHFSALFDDDLTEEHQVVT